LAKLWFYAWDIPAFLALLGGFHVQEIIDRTDDAENVGPRSLR
jgi:hypothetical protein